MYQRNVFPVKNASERHRGDLHVTVRQQLAIIILSELRKLRQTRVQSEENTETAVRDLLLVDTCTQTTFEDIYPTCEIATLSG